MWNDSNVFVSCTSTANSDGQLNEGASCIRRRLNSRNTCVSAVATMWTVPRRFETSPPTPSSSARQKTKGRNPTPCTRPRSSIRHVSESTGRGTSWAPLANSSLRLRLRRRILAYPGCPPDAARAFIRNHAGPDGPAWCTGSAIEPAFVGVDFA